MLLTRLSATNLSTFKILKRDTSSNKKIYNTKKIPEYIQILQCDGRYKRFLCDFLVDVRFWCDFRVFWCHVCIFCDRDYTTPKKIIIQKKNYEIIDDLCVFLVAFSAFAVSATGTQARKAQRLQGLTRALIESFRSLLWA